MKLIKLAETKTILRGYKYRFYPTKSQEIILNNTIETCRLLYNKCLEERKNEFKLNKRSISYNEQLNKLPKNKTFEQEKVYAQVLQNVIRRVDTSYKNFFRRCKEKKQGKNIKVGFPRFKSKDRYNSFTYPQLGFKLNDSNVYFSKIGNIKLVYSRSIEGTIKTCTIKREIDQWYVIFSVEKEIVVTKSRNPKVGIDVGIKSLVVVSDGTIVENPKFFVKSQDKLKKAQKCLARKKKGSENRKKQRTIVAKTYRKIARQRDDFLHKESRKLVNNYGTIYFEDLNIKGMVRNHNLAKSIQDCSWGKLIQYTQYKAEEAGVGVELVNPRNTSQTCSGCGRIVKKTLGVRVHSCYYCGLLIDRDLNAARNICTVGTTGTLTPMEILPLLKKYKLLRQVESLK